jgi:hypothetical protein
LATGRSNVPERAAAISYTRALLTAAKAPHGNRRATLMQEKPPVYATSLAGIPHSDRRRAPLDNG